MIADIRSESKKKQKMLKTIGYIIYETNQESNYDSVAKFSEDDELAYCEAPKPVPLFTAQVYKREWYAAIYFKTQKRLKFYHNLSMHRLPVEGIPDLIFNERWVIIKDLNELNLLKELNLERKWYSLILKFIFFFLA